MSLQHTPGPWHVAHSGCVVADVDAGHRLNAEAVRFYGGHLIAESIALEANVRLIAAAPDLLAACRCLIRFCSGRDGRLLRHEDWIQTFMEDGSTITEAVALAQAAIVKAEGGAR